MTGQAPAPHRNGRSSRGALIGIGGMVAAVAILFCLVFGGIVLPVAATDASGLLEALWVLVALGVVPALFGGVLVHSGWRPGTGAVARRAGWLIVGLCGSYALYFIASASAHNEDSRSMIVAVIVGVVPTLLGAILVLLGRRLRRISASTVR
jgi:hypothetical protein